MNAINGMRRLRPSISLVTSDIITPLLRPSASAEKVVLAIVRDPMVNSVLGLFQITPGSFEAEVPLQLPPKISKGLLELANGSDYKLTLKIGYGNQLSLVITKEAKR